MVAKGQDYDGESKSPDTGMLATKPSSTVDQVNLPVCDFWRSGRSGACGDLSELVPVQAVAFEYLSSVGGILWVGLGGVAFLEKKVTQAGFEVSAHSASCLRFER